jgi:hypothetical protein
MTHARRRHAARAVGALLLGLAPAACMQTVILEHADGGASSGVDGGDSAPSCQDGVFTALSFTLNSPDVVIALDRSASTSSRFGDGTRLTVAQDALRQVVATYQNVIRFGYEEFPTSAAGCADSAGCCAGDVTAVPAPRNQLAIERAMDQCVSSLGGCTTTDATPTARAIARSHDFYAGFDDRTKDRFVLLMTDGNPSCANNGGGAQAACNDATSEIAQLNATEVKTIVVGVGEDVIGSNCLDSMALAGGAERDNRSPYYYNATDAGLLTSHLATIMHNIARLTCHIDLRLPTSDPAQVQLFLSGAPVPRDATNQNGWNFDAGSSLKITIYGSWCEMLQGADSHAIDLLGCSSQR